MAMMPGDTATALPSHVLVVDDEPLIASGLRVLFESQGMQVSTAANGLEAMDLLSATPFAAIITDLDMPGCDGAELIAEIRRRDGRRLPIILLTADHHAGKQLAATENLQVLCKPAGADEITAAMDWALRNGPRTAVLSSPA